MADHAVSLLDSVQSAYNSYVAQQQFTVTLAGEYMKSVWYATQADFDAINAVSQLPITVGNLGPSFQQVGAYRAAFGNFEAGANYFVANNTAVVQVATEAHDRLERDLQIASVLTLGGGLLLSGAQIASKQGLLIAIKIVAGNVAKGAMGAALVSGVLQGIAGLASASGASPNEVRAGMDLIQVFLLYAAVRKARAAAEAAATLADQPWLQRIKQGIAFDLEQSKNFDYNQIYVDGKYSDYFKLDSYDPAAGEIISRKFTQLGNINLETALKYINEIPMKYAPGTTIANVPTNGTLAGQELKGQMILEVPVQTEPIPQVILDAATEAKVIIRDIEGKVYNND